MSVPVAFVPLALQPDVGRVYASLPEGWTIKEIVNHYLADAPETVLDRVIVTMINGKSSARVPRRVWHRVRPHAGTQIIIMIAPGRSAFSLLISIAAIAVSTFVFPAGAAGILGLGLQASRSLVVLGVTALGGLLLNALFPAKKDKGEKPTFAITGWQNEARPDDVVPRIFGTVRYAPPFAASPYIEVVGDILYIRAVFLWGFGPVEVSDLRIGDTPTDKFDELQIETRLGYDTDLPLTLYTEQVIQEKVGADLLRLYTRDDAGEQLTGSPVEDKPIERNTARDATYARIILSFPAGLGKITSKGKKRQWFVTFGLRIKQAGSDVWQTKPDITIRAKKFAGIYREIRIDFPVRGTYAIELTRKTISEPTDDDENQYAMDCTWVVLQSFRPEYPINFNRPVAMTAVRVKSTYQLNGDLDTFNGLVKGVEPDWEPSALTQVLRSTRNPAAHALFALTGPMLYRPVTDDKIDYQAFSEWHEFCMAKGLTYDRAHDFDESFGERMAAIGAAGRAAVRWDGRKWRPTIDRPREIPADFITPRNSSGLSVSQSYFEPPHAYRVQFLDETNEYQQANRTIPWPGHVGEITIVEDLPLPGITNPDRIWIETRRRQYEAMYRSSVYSGTQTGLARTATTGDLVLASRDILRRAMASARVVAVDGDAILLDEVWTMEANTLYALRFRIFDASDTIGTSVVRALRTIPGESNRVIVKGTGEMPEPGALVMFGPWAEESKRLIVVGIERGKDNATILTMLPEAAIIDDLTDAEMPPTWDGKVGLEIGVSATGPAVPLITSVLTGVTGTGSATGLTVLLAPGLGSAVKVETYLVEHRLTGAGSFSGPITCTGAEASIDIPGYAVGDSVEFRAWAKNANGDASGKTSTLTKVIGAGDAGPAAALSSVSITYGMGNAKIDFVTGANTMEVRVYSQAGTGGTLDREADLVAIKSVDPFTSASHLYGDNTRVNVITNGDFAASTGWTLGAGWTISGGVASKTAGSASVLDRLATIANPGIVYRYSFNITARSAGQVAPCFFGGTGLLGTYYNSTGIKQGTLTSLSGNNDAGFLSDSAFVGSIDDFYVYQQSTGCAPQGARTFWLETFNADGTAGALSGPYTGTII